MTRSPPCFVPRAAFLAAALALSAACQTVQGAGGAASGASPASTLPEESAEQRAARRFAEGVAHLKAGQEETQLAHAAAAFEEASALDPGLVVARYNLAVIQERRGDVDEAARLYRTAFEQSPKLELAAGNLGRLLEAKGDVEAARELYREAIEKYPETVGPRLRLARLAHLEDDPQTAAQLAREALQFDGQSVEAYRLLARLYAERQKNQLARLIAIRGQKLAPDDPELTYSLALVAQNEGNIAAARELLQKVIANDADHAEARQALAQMSLETKDWQTAVVQLEALRAVGQQNPSLHVNLGLALKGQGRFDEARQAYERALAVGDAYPPALLNLGVLELRHLDQPAKAAEHLRAYLGQAEGSEDVEGLLQEARILIEAKAEEQRQLELIAQQEAEAARLAEEEAARAAEVQGEAAPALSGEPSPGGAAGELTGAAEGAPSVEEPRTDSPPERKRPGASPKKQPTPKASPDERAPERDDDFFND